MRGEYQTMNTQLGNSTVGEMLPFFVVIGILLWLFISCVRMFMAISKIRKEKKNSIQNLKNQGLTIHTTFNHVNGLPIAENILCEVFSYPDRIEFKSGTTDITLSRQKITDMCVKTDVEIQNQAVSSIGGAIAGGVVFGPLGAIIGGRAKNKKVKTFTKYLIITYKNSNNEIAFIGFDINSNPIPAQKLVYEFQQLNTTQGMKIDL